MVTDSIQDNKQAIEQSIEAIINDVFQNGAEVTFHGELQHADDQHTGIYASAFIHEASVTRTEQNQLKENGLHLVEQAAHITENPAMDDTLSEIPRDELADAAETDTELVLELDQNFLNSI